MESRSGHLQQLPQFSAAESPAADQNQSNVALQTALTALRKWWKLATPVGLLVATAAIAAIYLTFTPVYRASALIQIKPVAEYIVFRDAAANATSQFVNTQRELIRSQLVLGPVVARTEIAVLNEVSTSPDPVKALAAKIDVSSVGRSELYEIGFESIDADACAEVVNAVLEEYFRHKDEVEARRERRLIELLEGERNAHAQNVARLRDVVRELSKNITGKDPFTATPQHDQDEVANSALATLASRLTSINVEKSILRARLQTFREIDDEQPIEVTAATVEDAVDSHPDVQQLVAAISDKEQQLRETLSRLAKGEDDPLYKRLKAEVDQEKELLETTKADLRVRLREQLIADGTKQRATILEKMQSDVESLSLEEEIVQEQYEEKLADVKSLQGDTLELEFKRAELARAENVFDLVSARVMKLQTEQRAPPNVELLKKAETPLTPVEKLPFKWMSLAGCAGLFFPFGLAFLWEYRFGRMSDSGQLSQATRLPVLAEIATFPSGARNGRPASGRVSRALKRFQESVHGLRTYLALSDSLKDMQVLSVASAISQEGKTSVSTQLAISFARTSGQKVLLIDGDMRAPDVHNVFGIEADPGLAEFLHGDSTFDEVVNRSWSDNVHLIPGGRINGSDPHELMARDAFATLLEKARGQYGLVVIDTPPVLAASESLVMARHADAVLLCVMRDTSRAYQVTRTYERLISAGGKPIGAVFSGVPTLQYAYYYGNYKHYY